MKNEYERDETIKGVDSILSETDLINLTHI
jgi:hypothetical protein